MFDISHGFCARVDYINRHGEQHSTIVYGTEHIEDAEDMQRRMTEFSEAFKRLGRQVLHIHKIELSANAISQNDEPRQVSGANVVAMRRKQIAA